MAAGPRAQLRSLLRTTFVSTSTFHNNCSPRVLRCFWAREQMRREACCSSLSLRGTTAARSQARRGGHVWERHAGGRAHRRDGGTVP